MLRWAPLLLLLTFLVSTVPPVGAQSPPLLDVGLELKVAPYGRPITPITETVSVPFTFVVRCASVVPPLHPVEASFSVHSTMPWMVATVSPAHAYLQFDPLDCAQGHERVVNGHVQINVLPEAPAFTANQLQLNAKMDAYGEVEQEWTEMSGLYFRSFARFDVHVLKARADDMVILPLTFTNEGNGNVLFRSQVMKETSPALHVSVPPHAPVGPFGERATYGVEVQTPENVASERRDTLMIQVQPTSVDDRTLADDPIEITAVIQTTPSGPLGEELPGAPLPILLAMLGLLAVGARRRL